MKYKIGGQKNLEGGKKRAKIKRKEMKNIFKKQ